MCLNQSRGLRTKVSLLSLPAGPEYKSMKSCIYIGMATDDLDVSELVETIVVTAREIEENSRVCKTNQCLILFWVFPGQLARVTKEEATLRKCLFIHSLPLSFYMLPVSSALCQASGTPGGFDTLYPLHGFAGLWERSIQPREVGSAMEKSGHIHLSGRVRRTSWV